MQNQIQKTQTLSCSQNKENEEFSNLKKVILTDNVVEEYDKKYINKLYKEYKEEEENSKSFFGKVNKNNRNQYYDMLEENVNKFKTKVMNYMNRFFGIMEDTKGTYLQKIISYDEKDKPYCAYKFLTDK